MSEPTTKSSKIISGVIGFFFGVATSYVASEIWASRQTLQVETYTEKMLLQEIKFNCTTLGMAPFRYGNRGPYRFNYHTDALNYAKAQLPMLEDIQLRIDIREIYHEFEDLKEKLAHTDIVNAEHFMVIRDESLARIQKLAHDDKISEELNSDLVFPQFVSTRTEADVVQASLETAIIAEIVSNCDHFDVSAIEIALGHPAKGPFALRTKALEEAKAHPDVFVKLNERMELENIYQRLARLGKELNSPEVMTIKQFTVARDRGLVEIRAMVKAPELLRIDRLGSTLPPANKDSH